MRNLAVSSPLARVTWHVEGERLDTKVPIGTSQTALARVRFKAVCRYPKLTYVFYGTQVVLRAVSKDVVRANNTPLRPDRHLRRMRSVLNVAGP